MELGWQNQDGKRTPKGGGWAYQNYLSLVVVRDNPGLIAYDGLGLSYRAGDASSDGTIELEIEAEEISGVDVTEEFEPDIEASPDIDNMDLGEI